MVVLVTIVVAVLVVVVVAVVVAVAVTGVVTVVVTVVVIVVVTVVVVVVVAVVVTVVVTASQAVQKEGRQHWALRPQKPLRLSRDWEEVCVCVCVWGGGREFISIPTRYTVTTRMTALRWAVVGARFISCVGQVTRQCP